MEIKSLHVVLVRPLIRFIIGINNKNRLVCFREAFWSRDRLIVVGIPLIRQKWFEDFRNFTAAHLVWKTESLR